MLSSILVELQFRVLVDCCKLQWVDGPAFHPGVGKGRLQYMSSSSEGHYGLCVNKVIVLISGESGPGQYETKHQSSGRNNGEVQTLWTRGINNFISILIHKWFLSVSVSVSVSVSLPSLIKVGHVVNLYRAINNDIECLLSENRRANRTGKI